MDDYGTYYAPGDTVPVSGIYHVVHDRIDGDDHARPHNVTVLRGTKLPPCRACQSGVRYSLYEAAENVEAHGHFLAK